MIMAFCPNGPLFQSSSSPKRQTLVSENKEAYECDSISEASLDEAVMESHDLFSCFRPLARLTSSGSPSRKVSTDENRTEKFSGIKEQVHVVFPPEMLICNQPDESNDKLRAEQQTSEMDNFYIPYKIHPEHSMSPPCAVIKSELEQERLNEGQDRSISCPLHGITGPLHLKPAPTLTRHEPNTHNNQQESPKLNAEKEMEDANGASTEVLVQQKQNTAVVKNQWSEPLASIFSVRGTNYLVDGIKTFSQSPSLFVARGVDIFHTTSAPKNIAQCPQILQGALRQYPSFIVNLRFSWGILVCYFEVPQKFLPFLQYYGNHGVPGSTTAYTGNAIAESELLNKSMEMMSPGERCLARFLMATQDQKNKTMKLIPVVVEGMLMYWITLISAHILKLCS